MEASAPPRPSRISRRTLLIVVPIGSVVAGLVLWQLLISLFHPNPLAVVGPLTVVRDAADLARAGTLWADVRLSLWQLLIGMLIAIVLGTLTGIALGTNRWLGASLGTWVTALYTIPVIAVTPLVIVGIGFGSTAKILIVAASAYFPIAINTQAGAAEAVDSSLQDVSRAFRSSWWETIRFLILPSTVPFILVGTRLAIGRALIALVAADLFGSTSGIGYLILSGQQNLKTDDVYVGVVLLSLIGIVLTAVVALFERRVLALRNGRSA
jgi:ABC-type nitrate/sulfonate/bicarbonate transport system permease component